MLLKKTTLLFFCLLLINTSFSQMTYTTKKRSCIKLFEKALKAPREKIDIETGMPNFKGGICLLKKAIDKDPNFIEAHLLSAEYHEYLSNSDKAIEHYAAAIEINPNHTKTGNTYYQLGKLLMQKGSYKESILPLNKFLTFRNSNPDYRREAIRLVECALFSIESIKNPVDFNPINVGPGINTQYPEYFPTITVDGKTMLFTRLLPNEYANRFKKQEDFFVSNISDDSIWQKAFPMPNNINTIRNEGAPTLSADGRSLVFVACPDASGENYGSNRYGKGSCDLFYTQRLGSRWMNPRNIPGFINTASWETQPSLSADGKTLYFIREIKGSGAKDNADIFVSNLNNNGEWGVPRRLSNMINTPYAEESVLIHPDGKTLYFASKGHVGLGGTDLFVSRLDENGNWSKPENLGYPINTHYNENSLMVSAQGEIAFFASNRHGGYGGLDIYHFNLPEHLRPTKTLYFEGIVYDSKTKLPIGGKFELIDLETGKTIVTSYADKTTGEFVVSLPINKEYALKVNEKGYTFYSVNFNMTIPEGMEKRHMDIPLDPIGKSDNQIVLANVFFDRYKSNLRPESYIELDNLVTFLLENPNVKIELGGHTDSRGIEKDNIALSTDRAKAVYDYLISRKINPQRMQYKGYGSAYPIFDDKYIALLNSNAEIEKAHQTNRRTVYKIIK